MDFIKGFGLISAALLVLLIFFLNYRSIWEATTQEPFTNILRRNKLRFSFIIPVGLAAAGGLVYLSLPRAWPWYTWVVVAMGFVWIFIGHIFWAGIRWGAIHTPTAWRCVEELKLMAAALEQGPQQRQLELASEELGARLIELGYPFVAQSAAETHKGSLTFELWPKLERP